jgi:hypothetical protein
MNDETMTSDTTESGYLTVADAASQIEGMLSTPEDSTKEQPEVVEEQTEVAEEVEEAEDEADYEEAVEATEDEVEEYEDSEVEESEEVEEEQTFTIKAAGEEKEVTLDELKKSYQLGTDYTKKTQEVAEQRKIIEQEAKAIIEARKVRDEYASKLQAVENFLMSNNDTPEDLAAMSENDPIGYAKVVADMTLQKEKLQTIQAEKYRLAQEQQSERANQLQQFVQEEAQKLSVSLPEFSDKAKGEQVRNDIRSYGKKIGFTDAELSQVYDSRHVLVLHKAAQYDKLMAGKANVKKKVAKAPRTVKGGAKVKQTNIDIKRKQMARLKHSGRKEDAAALFENFI